VIVPDLPRVGQLRPGDEVVFTVVDRPTAHAAFRRHERLLSERVIGWFPTESGV
jgi:allophanate hydrolase subunit 2